MFATAQRWLHKRRAGSTPVNDRQLGPRGPVDAGFHPGGQASVLGPYAKYKSVWENKAQPDPGSGSYAWETLGLTQFTFIGAGVSVRQPDFDAVLHTPMIAYQGVLTNGIPLTAGGIYGQPLYDNNGAVPDAPSVPGISDMGAWNQVAGPLAQGGYNSNAINNPFPQKEGGF